MWHVVVGISDHYAPSYDNASDGGAADTTYLHPYTYNESSLCSFTLGNTTLSTEWRQFRLSWSVQRRSCSLEEVAWSGLNAAKQFTTVNTTMSEAIEKSASYLRVRSLGPGEICTRSIRTVVGDVSQRFHQISGNMNE